jgi:hypothetical protein
MYTICVWRAHTHMISSMWYSGDLKNNSKKYDYMILILFILSVILTMYQFIEDDVNLDNVFV